MTCYELSEACQKTLDAVVLAKIAGQWLPVTGLKATGEHRNAVAIELGNIDGLDAFQAAAVQTLKDELARVTAERDHYLAAVNFAIKG